MTRAGSRQQVEAHTTQPQQLAHTTALLPTLLASAFAGLAVLEAPLFISACVRLRPVKSCTCSDSAAASVTRRRQRVGDRGRGVGCKWQTAASTARTRRRRLWMQRRAGGSSDTVFKTHL